MKQQIVIISGGDTFNTYNQYLAFLKDFLLDLARMIPQISWKQTLQDRLGENFEVYLPQMPNRSNAQYNEWKLWFEKILPLLDDNAIFIGHSLGGIFLAKYFSENTLAKKSKAVFLIAAPVKDINEGEPVASFALPNFLDKFSKQVEKIILIHSQDDQVVPFAHLEEYKKLLPSAEVKIFTDKGHFNQGEFPEIVEFIKSL